MKYLFAISFCCLVMLFGSCKKDNSTGNKQNTDNTSWLTGKWVMYKSADTSYYPPNASPRVTVHTPTADTSYNIINGSLKQYQISSSTMGGDTLRFLTSTNGLESYPNSDNAGTPFTYSLQTLTLNEEMHTNLTVIEYITKMAPDKIKVLTPDNYGFNEIIAAYYQKQ